MANDSASPAEASPAHVWLPASELRLRSGLLLQAQGTNKATPPFEARYIGAIEGKALFLDTLGVLAFSSADLRGAISNLRSDAPRIWSALDYALHGY